MNSKFASNESLIPPYLSRIYLAGDLDFLTRKRSIRESLALIVEAKNTMSH